MKIKSIIIATLLIIFSTPLFAGTGWEIGIGSGYIFYGDNFAKEANKSFGSSNQLVLSTEARLVLPLEERFFIALGGDTTFDGRWDGGNHLFHLDYSVLCGFRVYPGLAGLVCSVDYALGRRTDILSIDDYNDDDVYNTSWGNGFRFGAGYDFSVHTNGIAPTVGFAWKNMPRGGSRDNMISIFLKFGRKRPS